MKKTKAISMVVLIAFFCSCDSLNSSDQSEKVEYQFETDKTHYSSKDTINASFANQSNQTLFLNYQICTIADMQKLKNDSWKSIPVPVFCTAEAKAPVEVDPGEEIKTAIALELFDDYKLEFGIYRLDVMAIQKNSSQEKELTSNNFEISL